MNRPLRVQLCSASACDQDLCVYNLKLCMSIRKVVYTYGRYSASIRIQHHDDDLPSRSKLTVRIEEYGTIPVQYCTSIPLLQCSGGEPYVRRPYESWPYTISGTDIMFVPSLPSCCTSNAVLPMTSKEQCGYQHHHDAPLGGSTRNEGTKAAASLAEGG